MATLQSDIIGVLNIELRQGDNKSIRLAFNQTLAGGGTEPIDLTEYSAIRLDVKSRKDVFENPFISWQLGAGLTISGANDNVLGFEFSQEFTKTSAPDWYYDIKFTKPDGVIHLVEGQITIKPVTTK